MKIVKILQLALLFISIDISLSSPPCGNGYGQEPCVYLPAKPGSTPPCATPGSTFCENIHGYPENLIKKLLKNYMSKDILTDESKTDFGAKKRHSYNFPAYGSHTDSGYNYGPFDSHGDFHEPAVSNHHFFNNNNNFNYHRGYKSSDSEGYHYPRPPPSTSSFFNRKPPTFNHHPDYFRRTSRQIHSAWNETKTKRPDDVMLSNRFLSIISPSRSKRQISPNREQLCEVRSKYINPQAALNARTGNWMYIVNGVETATQLVRTETCVSSRCSNLCQLPNGYNSRCEQKYVQKRLVTLDPQGEKLLTELFWFPSCCVCTLSNTVE